MDSRIAPRPHQRFVETATSFYYCAVTVSPGVFTQPSPEPDLQTSRQAETSRKPTLLPSAAHATSRQRLDLAARAARCTLKQVVLDGLRGGQRGGAPTPRPCPYSVTGVPARNPPPQNRPAPRGGAGR